MPQQVRGVVARRRVHPSSVETIVVPDPGPGEAVVQGPGLRRLPHRPALPRGRHQRRLPVPARPRGRRCRRVGRRGRHRRRARRLRHPQLARRLRRLPRLPPRRPWYCFNTHNATQKMTLDRRHRSSPPRWASARSSRRPSSHAGQCTKVDPAAQPEVAGLLGCGVMAGIGAAINTGNVGRGDSHRRHRLRRGRQRRHRRRPARRRAHDHRRRRRRPEARLGQGLRRDAHVNSREQDAGRGDPGAHRRQRRRRRHRRGRPPRDLHSRPSTPATSPAPSCSSACPPRT